MAKRVSFLVFVLINIVVLGSEKKFEEKAIVYQKGQGLNFDFPSDPKKRQKKARQMVKSLNKQGLTLNDILKDHLKKKEKDTYTNLKELLPGVSIDLMQNYLHNNLQKSINIMASKKRDVTFEGEFSKSFKAFVKSAFEKSNLLYPITVKIDNSTETRSLEAATNAIPTNNGCYEFSLYLPDHTWGQGTDMTFLSENELYAQALIAHEVQHVNELHGLKKRFLLEYLHQNNCEFAVMKKAANIITSLAEHEADCKAIMNNDTRFSMYHSFKIFLQGKERVRPSEYLQPDDLSKIVSLYEAERSQIILISHGVSRELLDSNILPFSMKNHLFNSIENSI